MKIHKKYKHIDVDVYNASVIVVINMSDKEFKKALLEDEILNKIASNGTMEDFADKVIQECDSTVPGQQGVCADLGGAIVFVRLFIPIKTIKDQSVLVHELYHATFSTLEIKGIRPCRETEESFAYLQDYLFCKCYE